LVILDVFEEIVVLVVDVALLVDHLALNKQVPEIPLFEELFVELLEHLFAVADVLRSIRRGFEYGVFQWIDWLLNL